jgi:hypothetical protein
VPTIRRALAVLFLLPITAAAQTRTHIIQGRVTSDSGAALPAADIIVTVAPSAETILGKTDATGAYKVTIANPTGEYILNISALGYKPFRQRVTIAAGDSAATVNAKLAANVQQVAAVRVQATRPRPPRTFGSDIGGAPGTDGTNKTVDGVVNALPPELQGNIDAMAGLIPGLALTPGGFSAFGLGSDANMKTLNGMSFGGDAVPRDMNTSTRFASSPWDPTRGGFSGALASTTVQRGTNITTRRGRVTLDAPMLQVTDPIASRFGQKFSNVQLGGASIGAFSLDKYFYDVGYQAAVNRAPVSSLLDLDADALAHAGISPDSAFRLTQILGVQHVPLTVGGIPDQRTSFGGSVLGRFDYALPTAPGVKPLPQWNVVAGANYNETRGSSLSPTALPATTGKNSRGGGLVQGLYSKYLGKNGDYVSETSLGASYDETRGTPYLTLPSGNVLIASALNGAAPTIGSLNFGGNGALARDTRNLAFEANNQTGFLINNHQTLPATIYVQSRYEHYDQSLASNRFGSFNYASLGDLASNRPSSFSRTLNTPDRSGGEWMGAAALGANYNTRTLVITGGARVDANAFTGLPTYNPKLDQAFGIRNDRAPNSVALSPRLGFNWYYKSGQGISINNSGFATLIRGGPQLRGGFGEFRNFLRSDVLADAIGATGLPGSSERLTCTGPAAPVPNWQSYMNDPSTIPTTCLGGATVFADTAPNATLIDPSYSPMHAWRGTLGWTNTILGMYFAIDGTYSMNRNQPGVVDLNFDGSQRFTLADEGNRPVFVSPSSIVGATGSVSPVESRRTTEFGRVSDRLSDLKGDSKQLTAYLVPNIPFRIAFVTLGYTYADARSQARGFDQSTATDPRLVEWAANGFTPKHQFIVQAARSFFKGAFALTTSTRITSGLRYTPTIGGDVNGDGWFNDRAFVFDPARADTGVARGLRDLLANGSSSARNCLSSQINTLAGRNSCIGPWLASMNASIFVANVPRTNNRMSATLNLANPLGGLDQLLHGSDHLHGWGASPFIDGTLYQVRGFDANAKRYLYQVNPRFGNTSPSTSTFRSPFRITLDVRMNLGHDAQEQAVMLAMRVKPPLKGTRASADTIKSRYMGTTGTNGFSDIYKLMLRYADSIALSRDQAEKVQARQKVLIAKADSVYGELGRYLAALPAGEGFDAKDAAKHVTDASNGMWDIIYAERPWLKELLTPGQIRLLPGGLREMVLDPGFKGKFYYGF